VNTATIDPSPSAVPVSPTGRSTLRLEARKGWQALNFREVWRYRELLGFLAARDIKVRYKQTALGILWAIVPPLMLTFSYDAIFTLVGSKKPSGALNYQASTFTAVMAWGLFASVLSQSGNSLVANTNLISKVYFPRLIIPLSTVLTALVDFFIAAGVLATMLWWKGLLPGVQVFFLPGFILLAILAALSAGLWLSALNVRYRDIKYVIPLVTQVGMLASPVIYSTEVIRGKWWEPIYMLNPMAGVLEGFRWALFHNAPAPRWTLALSVVMTLVLLIGGLFYFKRTEKSFADLA